MRIYNDKRGIRSFIRLYCDSYADIWGNYNLHKSLKTVYSVYTGKPHCVLTTNREKFMFMEIVTS